MNSRNKCLWLVRIVIAITILFIGIFFVFSNKYFDTSYNKIQSFDEIEPIEFGKGDILKQNICATDDKINRIGICLVNRTNNCSGNIAIKLLDENNTTIWKETVNVQAIQLQKITWFRVQQYVHEHSEYTLMLAAEEMRGTVYVGAINTDKSAKGCGKNAIKNENELLKALVVELTFYAHLDMQMKLIIIVWAVVLAIYILSFEKMFISRKRGIITLALTIELLILSIYFRAGFDFNERLNYVMFAGLVVAFVITDAVYLYMLHKNVERAELYFAVSTLIFGTVYSLILQPFAMPDEEYHFAQAYRLSNAIMGQPINDENGYIYMRECDINERVSCPNNSYTIDMLKALIRGNNERSEVLVSSECLRTSSSPIIMYLAQAIGVTIGRLLHFNYVRVIFMGRLMSLLMFIIITYWAIKIIPYGKWVYWAICQIPMVLETVSSQSYDTIILALAFLFVAYLLKFCTQEVKVKQIAHLAVIAFLFAPLKPTYMPLAALVFLIPNENISNNKLKSWGGKLVVLGSAFLAVILVYKCGFGSMRQIEDVGRADIRDEAMAYDGSMAGSLEKLYKIEDNDPYYQPNFEFIIENPFDIAEGLMGAYIVYADEYLLALFGCGLGRLWDLHNPTYVGLLTMLLLCIAYKKDGGQGEYIINLGGRLWGLFLIAGSTFAVFLAMYMYYTMPSSDVIGGVQGRYMLPMLITLPIFLKRRSVSREKEGFIMLSHIIQVLAVLSVCMQIWNRYW